MMTTIFDVVGMLMFVAGVGVLVSTGLVVLQRQLAPENPLVYPMRQRRAGWLSLFGRRIAEPMHWAFRRARGFTSGGSSGAGSSPATRSEKGK
jgi:hypothetical protein